MNYRANKTISQLSTGNENIGVDVEWIPVRVSRRIADDDSDETVRKRARLGGRSWRRRAHRGIGPGCWPMEVGARAVRMRGAWRARQGGMAPYPRDRGSRGYGAILPWCVRQGALVLADGGASCQAHVG
jgi:hypothetical protein